MAPGILNGTLSCAFPLSFSALSRSPLPFSAPSPAVPSLARAVSSDQFGQGQARREAAPAADQSQVHSLPGFPG